MLSEAKLLTHSIWASVSREKSRRKRPATALGGLGMGRSMMSQDSLESLRHQPSLLSEIPNVDSFQDSASQLSLLDDDALYDPHARRFEHPDARAGFTPGSKACNGAWNNHVAPAKLGLIGKTERQILRPKTAKDSKAGRLSSDGSVDVSRKMISLSLHAAREGSMDSTSEAAGMAAHAGFALLGNPADGEGSLSFVARIPRTT